MLVVNPPWKFEREAKSLLEWLAHALAEDSSGTTNERWLTAE
jgi:23S rRNA A2030 N6-methylase RlmJ